MIFTLRYKMKRAQSGPHQHTRHLNSSLWVNILPLFRYFGYGIVLDFWHFSEKFFGRSDIVSLKKWKTFPKCEKRLKEIKKKICNFRN